MESDSPSQLSTALRSAGAAIAGVFAALLILVGEGMRRNPHDLDRRWGLVVFLAGVLIAASVLAFARMIPAPRGRHAMIVAVFLLIAATINAVLALCWNWQEVDTLLPLASRWTTIGTSFGFAMAALGLALNAPWGRAVARGVLLFSSLLGWPIGLTLALYGWWATRKSGDRVADA